MNQNEIPISDLGLATVLVTLEYKLLSLDRTNPKKIYFIFEAKKDIQKSIEKYWNDKIELPAQTLFNNQKMLKSRIYSGV